MIKRMTAATLTALTVTTSLPALAGGPVVVELFTSQGCSSCPPADALLGELVDRDDVIALSLHVDYWDYLGWIDEFADPAYTDRQRGYARAANSTMIYTPQIVVAGKDQIVGTKGMQLARHIERHKSTPNVVSLSLTRDGADKLQIVAQRTGAAPSQMLVQMVRYMPEQVVDIHAGENAGKSITYHNVVASLDAIGQWNGQAELKMLTDAPGDSPAVVLIQDGPSGPILAAARIE